MSTPPPAPGTQDIPADDDYLRLDLMVCFSAHVASRAFDSVYRVLLKDLGLTYPQFLVMLVLWQDGEQPVKRLGKRLRLDSGTLSPLLKRLEAAGLVVRERSADDERSVHVRPTERGAALKERAAEVPRRLGDAMGCSLDEVLELKERLDRLTAALDSADLTPSGPAPREPRRPAPSPADTPTRA